MLFVPQTTPHNCGQTCVNIVLANLNGDPSFLMPINVANEAPISIKNIIEYASRFNLQLTGFALDDKDELLNNEKFPFLAIIYTPNGMKHCIVVESIKRKRVKIADPAIGIYTLPFKKFKESFTGKGLLIEDYKHCQCDTIYENSISKKDFIISGIIQVLGACCLAAGMFFLDNNTKPFLPLSLLFFFIIFEILLRHHNFALMKKLDDFYINNNNFIIKNYPLYLQSFEEYKKDALVGPMKLVMSLMVCIFLTFITIMNNQNNVLLILLPIVLSLVDMYIVNPWLKIKENKIKVIENGLETIKDRQEFKDKANLIHDETYAYGKIQLIKKYFYIFLMISCSVLVMFLQKSIILPYLVFYVMIQYLFMENIMSILSYQNSYYEMLKRKSRLFQCIKKE